VITAAGASYDGNAYHGSKRVGVDGTLYNYGVLGFTRGVVDTDGGTVLNKRKGPGTSYAKTGTVADGATVTVSCSKRGHHPRGPQQLLDEPVEQAVRRHLGQRRVSRDRHR
jgi:LasA protease